MALYDLLPHAEGWEPGLANCVDFIGFKDFYSIFNLGIYVKMQLCLHFARPRLCPVPSFLMLQSSVEGRLG